MLKRPTNRLRLIGCLTLACALAASAHAASISAAAQKGYGRVNFNFDAPAKMKANVNGNRAVLNFDKPLADSPEAIKAALPDYVTGASLSADKRSLTLTMNKPYRLRQFVTNTGVGVDLLGGGDAAETASTNKNKAEPAKTRALPEDISADAPELEEQASNDADPNAEPEPTKPKAATKEATAPESKKPVAKKKPEAKPAPLKTATAAPVTPVKARDAEVLSTKKPEKKTEAKPVPAPKEKPVAEAPILSTKPAVPEPVAAPAAPVTPAAEQPVTQEKPTTPPPAIDDDVATVVVEPTATPVTPPAATETVIEATPVVPAPSGKVESGPFIVTAKTIDGEASLNFPWSERTAAASFRRGNDIWLVFSRAADVNVPLVRSILPKQVAKLTQYAYPSNTVLRFTTDGSVHARAEQVQGRYGWNMIFSKTPPRPSLDAPVVADTIDGTARLLIGAFDVAPELRFYDPNAGDALIIIPSFENARGVANERNFPELTVLASPQGIAMVMRRDDVTFSPSRAGLVAKSKNGRLAISDSLPQVSGSAPIAGTSLNSGVLMPYDQWYVPKEKFRDTELLRLHAVTSSSDATKADALFELAKLYLNNGFGSEALGPLRLIQSQFPAFYTSNKLALLTTAAYVMDNHIIDAASAISAPELNDVEEAILWREVVALYAPEQSTMQAIQQAAEQAAANATNDSAANITLPAASSGVTAPPAPLLPATKPVFHFLKYNKGFIRFYPPRIRQRLAQLAGDAYLADGQEEKALATYDTLVRDNLLDPVRNDAEYALGRNAEKKGEFDQAYQIYDRMAAQTEDRRIAIRARHAAALLRYTKQKITADEATEILESARTAWRGDMVEHDILRSLIGIYGDAKRHDDVLRSYKSMLEGFPGVPDALGISSEMSNLFERVFLDGLAEEMPPLKALSLFYEFRDLTPLGEKGDKMIQRLADRLAAIDLLDRATQLLQNQIKFRSTGEARSQIGARLALLQLLDQKPQDALSTLEVTNFGGNAPALFKQRQQMTAEALSKLGRHDEAIAVIANDTSKIGALLKLDILWTLQDWPSVTNHAEDILNSRANLTEPLSTSETEVLLKLALGYAFESDYTQLRYLRDYYAALIPDSGYKQIFDFITNDTNPLDTQDFVLLAQQISRTESFLATFKSKIAAGKLSEAIQ